MRGVVTAVCMLAAVAACAGAIEIRTAADLRAVAENLGATYELVNDIDLSGEAFAPIGSVDNWGPDAFTGTFRGNGHRIAGLRIDDAGSNGFVGLFRATRGARITDLTVEGEITAARKNCGGLVGQASETYFSNCVTKVSIRGGQYTGGFVGQDSASRFVRCTARGTLSIRDMYCGGFAGYASGEYFQCVSAISASAPNGTGGYVQYGGFAGQVSNATFRDCAATGSLSVRNNNIFGGFAGNAMNGRFLDCYSAVDISLGKGGRTGGFVGVLGDDNPLFERCFVCGMLSAGPGTYGIGAFCGDPQSCDLSAKMVDCHVVSEMDPAAVHTKAAWPNYFAENGAWGMVEGATLPYLRFRSRIVDGTEVPVYSVSVSIVGAGEATVPDYLESEVVAGSWVKVEVDYDYANGCMSFMGWEGDCEYENREECPTWVKVDRDVNAVARVEIGIWNADDLRRVGTDFNGREVTLMEDIQLTRADFGRIGTEDNPYAGVFNGNGHTITVDQVYTNQNNGGLFGYVDGAVIRNLTVKGRVTGRNTVGGVVGCADASGGVTLEDVVFVGEVKGVNYVGGLIGSSNGPFAATRCAAIANVLGNNEVSGFARYLGNYSTVVSECFAIGTATATNASGSAAGFVYTANGNGAGVTNCYAQVEVAARYASPLFQSCSSRTNNVYSGAMWTGAIDTDDHWFVQAGCTPVLRWSAPDGKVTAYAFDDAIVGAGKYVLGETAAIACTAPTGTCFVGWTGAAPYADRAAPTTTVRMGNHQLLSCAYGTLATTAEELVAGLHRDLAGTMVLGADIDLSPYSWKNVGTNANAAFRGRLVGNGHVVRGLDKPLFNHVDGAEISDVTFMGTLRDPSDYLAGAVRRVGRNGAVLEHVTFVGELHGERSVGGLLGYCEGPVRATRCAAVVNIVGHDYLSGFAHSLASGSSVNECFAIATVASTNSSGTVAGFIAYANNSGIGITNCYVQADLRNQDDGRRAPFVRFLSSSSFTNNVYWGSSWTDSIDADEHWLVVDGCTPVLKWSAPDGKVTAYAFDASIHGTGAYALGADASISCTAPDGKMFATWAGNAAYADPHAERTTVRMTNHQFVSCEYGDLVRTADELRAIASNPGGLFGLGADIDLSGRDWTPICNDRYNGFRGKFFGKGHRITGLNVDAPAGSNGAYDNRGLFGCVDGGTLDGVRVSGSVKGSSNVGGLVGYVKGAAVIENCEADVSVTGYNYVGGLVGKVEGRVRISGSKARGAVTGGGYLGGFMAYDYSGVQVSDCEAWGDVLCTGGGSSIGGFVGCINEDSSFVNCIAYGDVTSASGEYGGFMGRIFNSGARVERCAGYGSVSAAGTYRGRFAGRYFSGVVVDCATASNRNEGMPLDYTEKLTSAQVVGVVYDPSPDAGPYEAWAAENGVTTGVEATTGDIPNVFRYAFGIPAAKNLVDLDEPLLSISFADGRPVVKTPPVVNPAVEVVVLGTTDLRDWTPASRVELQRGTEGTWSPVGDPPARMYFRLSASPAR